MSFALARRFKQDVSTDGTTWVPLGGRTDFAPTEKATLQAVPNFDTNGFDQSEKTLTAWMVVSKFEMPTTAGIPSDPGQAILEATRFQFSDSARAYTRWYDRNGGTDAWSGRAIIDWNQSKTTTTDVAEITVTFTGDGVLTRIANPYAAAVVPVITSATPSGVAAAGQVTIYGGGFLGTVATTGVKFGGVNATSWVVLSDNVIVAVMPAGTAGSAPIIVTNAVGASAAFAYTRA
ncbi:MAG: hypothetical protein B7X07_06365 [Actinobacteria bacterium 21-64-8]|nr:MAG: hypothetical protein B7X07_06365 [Actinobacteria bacterium 21-64-8]